MNYSIYSWLFSTIQCHIFFEMCFHFQNVKGFVSVVFPFSEKHNCKQKSDEYIKLLHLFQLSRIYNLLYQYHWLQLNTLEMEILWKEHTID